MAHGVRQRYRPAGQYGLIDERVLRDPADGKTLLVMQDFSTLSGAQSFAADPELRADMEMWHFGNERGCDTTVQHCRSLG
jgi:hypothetical protein